MQTLAVAALLLVAGCGASDAGSTTPAPSSVASTSSVSTTPAGIATTEAADATAQTSTAVSSTAPAPAGSSDELADGAGWKYRITVTTSGQAPTASDGGCYPAPPPGQTNQRFTVTIDNLLTDRAAPLPDFVFGANLTDDGTATTNIATVEGSYQRIETFPRYPGDDCALALGFAAHGATIKAGNHLNVIVTVAAIGDPPPPGTLLLTRVFLPDGTKHDLTTPAT